MLQAFAALTGLRVSRATHLNDLADLTPGNADLILGSHRREPGIERATHTLNSLTVQNGSDRWGRSFSVVDSGPILPGPKERRPSLAFLTGQAVAEVKQKIKPGVGSERQSWRANNYHETFDVELLMNSAENVTRQDSRSLHYSEFEKRFENTKQPAVLTHVMDDWPATYKWTVENITRFYGDEMFKCGQEATINMTYFVQYCKTTKDDDGIYIIDSDFPTEMRSDYTVPKYFPDNYLAPVRGRRRRPPYRWFVMGPARSGTGLTHRQLETSAWSSLLTGHKRSPDGTNNKHKT